MFLKRPVITHRRIYMSYYNVSTSTQLRSNMIYLSNGVPALPSTLCYIPLQRRSISHPVIDFTNWPRYMNLTTATCRLNQSYLVYCELFKGVVLLCFVGWASYITTPCWPPVVGWASFMTTSWPQTVGWAPHGTYTFRSSDARRLIDGWMDSGRWLSIYAWMDSVVVYWWIA